MALIDKETIYSEIEARREHMVYELYGLEENTPEYQRVKGMHDAYVDMLTYLTYSLPEQPKLKPMNIPSAGGGMSTTPPSFKLDVKPRITNKLFEECLANVDPAIRKEVSDNVDKMLGKQPVEYPTSTEMIAEWENNELPLLRDKDFRGDAERMAYNAFMDGFAKGLGYKK